jgi:hypothetical protein
VKVYIYPADHYGCGHYRLIWAAEALRLQGMNVVVMPYRKGGNLQAVVHRHPDGRDEVQSLRVPDDADVVVVQRPAYMLQPQMINIMRSNGIAVVVDMDDDMTAIHPGNSAFEMYRTSTTNGFDWKHASTSCRLATYVTTSTAQLQKVYAKHGRGVVIDNYVPEAVLRYEPANVDGFGWAGTIMSHPADLQVMGRTPQRLIDEGFPFRVVGPDKKVKECLRLKEAPTCTGYVDLANWIQTIGQTYSVGLIPLESSSFNSAKSRLKGIENMAAGIPWVASPRGEYRRLHRESGCGFLAETPKEWNTHIKRLLTDDVLRKEQAEQGRQYMEKQTIQANAWRWAEAWETALKIERSSST